MAKKKIEELTPEKEVTKITGIVNVLSNFRKNPATDADIISVIEANTKVTVISEEKVNDFYNVELNGTTGYVKSDLVDLK